MFNRILIIDTDTVLTTTIAAALNENLHTEVDVISNYTNINVEELLTYDLYIIRIDNQTKSSIKYFSNLDKLILVLTDQDTKKMRQDILSLSVTDYIITNSILSFQTILTIIKRLDKNTHRTILIVDDSKLVLLQLSMILDAQNLNYIQFSNGQEAWDYLKKSTSKKVDLVVTDYEMPEMDGYELVQNIRNRFHIEELPVLVISGTEDSFMISKFLKAGANDYINKPFIHEELIARITNSLSLVSMFHKIKNMAMTDFLTNINNRVYLYDVGVNTLAISRRAQQPVAVAMLDIDNFKKLNDTYGHETGDRALIHVANIMKKSLRRSDILVRFGGEEFVMLLPNCPLEKALQVMNKICKLIDKSNLTIDDKTNIHITASIGVTNTIDTLDNMIEIADKHMYHAKNSGKNRVYSQE